jgi:hypothetical protein
MVPWFQLHARHIESFRREGDRTTIGLEGNATIEIDWNVKKYSASLAGVPILEDTSIFCPLGEDRIALYSVAGKKLSVQLPAGWQPSEIRAARLTADGAQEFTVRVDGGRVLATVEPRQPVMVYRNDAAKQRQRQLDRSL